MIMRVLLYIVIFGIAIYGLASFFQWHGVTYDSTMMLVMLGVLNALFVVDIFKSQRGFHDSPWGIHPSDARKMALSIVGICALLVLTLISTTDSMPTSAQPQSSLFAHNLSDSEVTEAELIQAISQIIDELEQRHHD